MNTIFHAPIRSTHKTRILFLSAIIIFMMTFLYGAFSLHAAETRKGTITSSGSYIHETAFRSDHDLTGMLATCSETFYTGDWDYSDASLTLYFSSTPLARKEISDFTISLNGTRFYSSRLPEGEKEINEMKIDIPTYLLSTGTNTITIESYIRTNESSNCSDNISDATWMSIFKDSYVSVTYKSLAKIENIADCYEQFTSIDALENNQSAVFINNEPTDGELTAASYVLSGISANAVYDYQNIQLISTSDYSASTDIKYGICVSIWDNLPETLKSMIPKDAASFPDDSHGLIYLVKNNQQTILVVTGKDVKSLTNTARLFGNQALMSQSQYMWQSVRNDEDVTFDWTTTSDDSVLTETGTYLYGPFRQSTDYYISRGSNLLLKKGSSVTLNFRYATNLDFDRSMMTVYINDTPIGSVKLSDKRANADSVTFSIPDNLNFSGTFTLRVAFDLEIKDLPCTIRSEEMPWAYISPASYMHLKTSESPYLLFDYYPAPFVNNGKLNNVKIVLPNEISDADLKVMSDISLTLGRYTSDNSGNIWIAHNSSAGDLNNMNLISIGKYSSNPYAQKLNDDLFFQFSPKGTTFISNEKKDIEANYGATLGTGQLLYSPYSKKSRAFLLISGVNDTGMLNADHYLGDSSMVYNISGDGFVADSDNIYSYRFKADNSKKGSLISALLDSPQLMVLLAMSLFVLLMIIVFTILFNIRNRRERK